jgi:hypothetical protein
MYMKITFIIIVFLFLICSSIPYFKKRKKEKLKLIDYIKQESSYIQFIGLIASFFFSASAIYFAIDSYESSSEMFNILKEQKNIAEKDLSIKIQPKLKIEYIEDHFSIIGFKLTNEGMYDIEDINIYQKSRLYNINQNKFGGELKLHDAWKKIPLIKSKDSLKIFLDITEVDINNFRAEKNMYIEGGYDYHKGDIPITTLIYNFKFKRPTDKTVFSDKKILIGHDVNISGKMTFVFISDNHWSISDEDRILIKKIEFLDNLIN